MSGREVIAVVVIVAALAVAVAGVVAIVGRLSLTLAQREVGDASSREQRRHALGVIRSGGAPAPGEQALVVAVAAGLASHAGVALTYAGLALTSASLALGTSSTPVVAAVVAAVGNAVVAVALAARWRRGRGYLDAHPGLQRAGRAR